MNALRLTCWMLLGLLVGGCTRKRDAPEPGAAAGVAPPAREARASVPVEEAAAQADAPVFGSLVTRFGTIETKLGPDGGLYTVTAPDGTVLARDIDSKELEAGFPEFHLLMEADVDAGGAYAGMYGHGRWGLGYVDGE
jgi:hypothetical protein